MLEKLTKLVGKYPKITLVAVLALTILLFFGMNKIRFTGNFDEMLPKDDPKIKALDEVEETFGGAELVMALISFDNIFTSRNLKTIDELTKGFEKVKGVERVISIINIEEIKGIEEGIEVSNLIEEIPETEKELKKLKAKILSDENFVGNIISDDGKLTTILIQVKANTDDAETFYTDIKKITKKIAPDKKIYFAGDNISEAHMKQIVEKDMVKLILIAMLLIILILYLSFRSFRGVILPISIVIITSIWLFGLMGFAGIPLSIISNIMPVVIIAIGIADAIHILTRYREETQAGFNRKEALKRTITAVGLACFLTSITTMVGFASLCFSPLKPIKELGISVAVGVGIAFIITVTFLLAILFLIPPFKKGIKAESLQNKKRLVSLSGILSKSSNFIIGKPRVVLFIVSIIIMLAIIGIPKITTDTKLTNMFKKDNPIRKTFDIIKEKFSGVDVIQVVVKGDITDPKVLRQIDEFQQKLKNIKILSKPASIVNILKDVNQALHEGDPKYELLPETKEGVAQYLLLLSMSGAEHLDKLITFDYNQALIQARVGSYSLQEQLALVKKIEGIIKKTFSNNVDVVLTGSFIIEKVLMKLLWKGQVNSLAFAIIAIFIMMIIVSKSFIYGLFCTLPIFLTVLLNFGIMGWFGIPFDVATAMLASVSIGIGIDYAIHFFSRFKEEMITGKEAGDSLKISITNTGTAILYNALAVGIGFFVLMFSSLPPLGLFGLLIALTMFFSSFISLTVLPALLFIYEKFKSRRRLV